jgi:hypothetical protein
VVERVDMCGDGKPQLMCLINSCAKTIFAHGFNGPECIDP